MIAAGMDDLPEVEAFFRERAETAMFPLNNLRRHGLGDAHPLSLRIWVQRVQGRISDVLALTRDGMLLPCFTTDVASTAATPVLRGRDLIGIIGPQAGARGVEAALRLQTAPRSLDLDEPHFRLDLSRLRIANGPGTLVPLQDAPEPEIRAWMLDYQLTALNTPASLAPQRVADAYHRMVAGDSHRVLMAGSRPLSMTGFNAALPDIVQIGGVYTPPALRGQGHARRAVALHLAQVAAQGVRRATLFSASDMAARAYTAIGFQRIGTWTLLLFDGAARVEG